MQTIINFDTWTYKNSVAFINENKFYFNYPLKKDGSWDMRFSICKLHKLLKITDHTGKSRR